MRHRGRVERAESSGELIRGVNSDLAAVAFGLCCACYWKSGGGARLQGSPVSFTFNAFNLIVLVELSKTEEEVGLSPLDLADRFFFLRWGFGRGGRAGSLCSAGSMILTPISLH